jgi:hypothetical protein
VSGHRRAALAALVLVALSAAACDKVYHARIDVGPAPGATSGAPALTPEERERAVAIFSSVASRLGLSCGPGKYPLITGSHDEMPYRLTECDKEHTQVQLAVAAAHVSVEVHKISGFTEPAVFRECRMQFAEALVKAFPSGLVTVRYPY